MEAGEAEVIDSLPRALPAWISHLVTAARFGVSQVALLKQWLPKEATLVGQNILMVSGEETCMSQAFHGSSLLQFLATFVINSTFGWSTQLGA